MGTVSMEATTHASLVLMGQTGPSSSLPPPLFSPVFPMAERWSQGAEYRGCFISCGILSAFPCLTYPQELDIFSISPLLLFPLKTILKETLLE